MGQTEIMQFGSWCAWFIKQEAQVQEFSRFKPASLRKNQRQPISWVRPSPPLYFTGVQFQFTSFSSIPKLSPESCSQFLQASWDLLIAWDSTIIYIFVVILPECPDDLSQQLYTVAENMGPWGIW